VLAPASLASAVAAGVLAGAGGGAVGGLVPLAVRVSVGTILATVLVVMPLLLPRRMPQLNRETEQDLLSLGPIKWAVVNGFLLGLGFASRIGFWVWYLVPLGCVILGSPVPAAIVWATYGCVRLGAASVLAWHMHRRQDLISSLHDRVVSFRPAARRYANPAAVALAAVLALWLGF